MKYLCLLLGLLLIAAPTHGATNHLIKHIELLSRDYFYIDFSRNKTTYKQQSNIGGEHETHYLILGFEGDNFIIKLHSKDGNVGHVPNDESYNIVAQHWDKKAQVRIFTVKIIAQQTWIDVSLSAHPFAQYNIEVERVESQQVNE
jgi:hypothetical protein